MMLYENTKGVDHLTVGDTEFFRTTNLNRSNERKGFLIQKGEK